MGLNTTQRVIILVGIVLIVGIGIYPPWTYTFTSKTIYKEEPAGYAFIASPPQLPTDAHMTGRSPRAVIVLPSPGYGLKIDMWRLLIQWAVTIAASGLGVLVTASRKDEQNN
jgi:hypothetical protein